MIVDSESGQKHTVQTVTLPDLPESSVMANAPHPKTIKSPADLPDSVKKSLPDGAEQMFVDALKAALKAGPDDAEPEWWARAWDKVNDHYKKSKGGDWEKKESTNPLRESSNEKALERIGSQARRRGFTFKKVFKGRIRTEFHYVADDASVKSKVRREAEVIAYDIADNLGNPDLVDDASYNIRKDGTVVISFIASQMESLSAAGGPLLEDCDSIIASLLSEARPTRLSDFQTATYDLTRQIGLAYNAAAHLKDMMDKMEEVTPSLKKTYARMMKLMPMLGDAKKIAHQSEMEMKRLK